MSKAGKETVRICGIDVDVVRSDPEDWASDGLGRMSQMTNTITLRKGLPKDVESQVLLHEAIHFILGLNNIGIPNEESTVSVLTTSLFAFIRDNNFTAEGAKE